MEKKEKNKKFKLFDMNRDGKGVEPGEDTTPTLKFFFKQFGRKFTKIITLNMLMDIQVLSLLICIYLYFFASPTTPSVTYSEFPLLYGIQQISTDAVTAVNLNGFSYQLGLPIYNTYVYWVIGIILLFHVLTYGLQKVGSVYVTRGLVRGDSVFIISDYFYAMKKNIKQAIPLGIIDCAAISVLVFDFIYLYTSPANGLTNFMYCMIIAIFIIYTIMRFYLYLMIVTFNIKLRKAFKNAFIFTILGIKRNLMAMLGLALITGLSIFLIVLLVPVGLVVVMVLPLIYFLGTAAFMYTYAAYPVIKKYMIDAVPSNPPASSSEEIDNKSPSND